LALLTLRPLREDEARVCLEFLVAQLQLVNLQILETDRRIRTSARSTEVSRRLMSIPGVGPLLASALVATVANPTAFKSGRNSGESYREPKPAAA
jgi:transposase